MSEVKHRGRPRKNPPKPDVKTPDLSDEEDVKTVIKEKRSRNRPDLANYGQEFIEPGDNRKFITFAMESRKLPKVDFDNPQAVEDRINWYFDRCATCDMKPGVVGLANALGVDRKSLWAYKAGTRRTENTQLKEIVERAYGFIEEMWEMYMQNGKISPPNGIFLGKNNFGYVDEQKVVVAPQNPYGTENTGDVRSKYIEGVQDDIPVDGNVK